MPAEMTKLHTHTICRNRGNNHPTMSLHRSGTAWAQEGVACKRCNHPQKTMPPASPACKSARHARTCAANAPCKALLRSKLMRPEFQCATMCTGTSLGTNAIDDPVTRTSPCLTNALPRCCRAAKSQSMSRPSQEAVARPTHILANMTKPWTWGHLHQCLAAQRMWGHLHQCLVALMRLQCWLVTADILLLTLPFDWLCCCTPKLPRAMPGYNLPPRQFVHCGCDQ